jgi:hypothetical protein
MLKSLEVFQILIGKFSLLRPFLLLAPAVSAGRTSRELWWTSQELSQLASSPWVSMFT